MRTTLHQRIDAAPGLTAFARTVYHVVATIPKGSVMTYAHVARATGKPGAVRAVGTALNRNPFAPDVPCHRVVRSDGTIGDFADGPDKKKALLQKEGLVVG